MTSRAPGRKQDELTAEDMQVCVCGDYRHQHIGGTGPSSLNWDNFKGVGDCVKFRPVTQPARKVR